MRVLDPVSEPEVVTMSVPVWPALVPTVVVETLVPVLIVVVPLLTVSCASALRSVMQALARTIAIIAAARPHQSDDTLPRGGMAMPLLATLSHTMPAAARTFLIDSILFDCLICGLPSRHFCRGQFADASAPTLTEAETRAQGWLTSVSNPPRGNGLVVGTTPYQPATPLSRDRAFCPWKGRVAQREDGIQRFFSPSVQSRSLAFGIVLLHPT